MVDALPVIESGVAQLGSLAELGGTVTELSGPALEAVTSRLAAADEKGYFAFARAGAGIADRVVTSFTEEDVEALGDNIVLILNTVKEMTQPEVMGMLRRTIHTVQDQDDTGRTTVDVRPGQGDERSPGPPGARQDAGRPPVDGRGTLNQR
jgi:hypothetical protein